MLIWVTEYNLAGRVFLVTEYKIGELSIFLVAVILLTELISILCSPVL